MDQPNQNDIIIDDPYYGNGEFDFVNDKSTKMFLKSAHKAISICELWDWLRIYEPPSGYGFMWSSTTETKRINNEMSKDPNNDLHSGSSRGAIMREMEYIAKNGYKNYKNLYVNI